LDQAFAGALRGGGNTRRQVDGWFARAGLILQPIMELGSIEAMKELANPGMRDDADRAIVG
jgi:hypothetical protein